MPEAAGLNVLGMTNTLFERLAPYLTVFSGSASVNLEFAAPWLVSVLSVSEDTAPVANTTRRSITSICHITVWATSNGGSNASLDWVVKLTPTGDQAYSILSWRAPARSILRTSG